MLLALLFIMFIFIILISAGSINSRSEDIRDGYTKPQWHDKISIHYLLNKLKK